MREIKEPNSNKSYVCNAREVPALEKSLEKRFRRECERRGWICLKFESPGNAGVPDRIVIDHFGNVSFVELKRGRSAKVMARQKWWNKRLRSLGAAAFFVRDAASMGECIAAIESRESEGRASSAAAEASGGAPGAGRFVKAVRYAREGGALRGGPVRYVPEDEKVTATVEMTRGMWASLLDLAEEKSETADGYDEWAEFGILRNELFDVAYGTEARGDEDR